GTAVVGLVIKHDSSEQSYDHYVINHLLKPLGMRHSGFDPTEIDVSKLALKYDLKNCDIASNCVTWWFAPNPSYDPTLDTSVLVPTASLFTSVWDLSRFMNMWLVRKAPNSIIKQNTLKIGSAGLISKPTKPVWTQICTEAAKKNNAGYEDASGNYYSP